MEKLLAAQHRGWQGGEKFAGENPLAESGLDPQAPAVGGTQAPQRKEDPPCLPIGRRRFAEVPHAPTSPGKDSRLPIGPSISLQPNKCQIGDFRRSRWDRAGRRDGEAGARRGHRREDRAEDPPND